MDENQEQLNQGRVPVSYTHLVYPDAGINVICGYNAQGKTNLLEALWLFTGAHSFRGAKDGELTAFSKESGEKQAFSKLNLTFLSGGREMCIRDSGSPHDTDRFLHG